MRKEDVMADGSDYLLSLSKLTGRKIKDVQVYLSGKLGDLALVIRDIVFEDGSTCGVEGEHDFPYLVNYRRTPTLPDDETMEDLNEQISADF